MRFKDEKQMWYADTEVLAAQLANKHEKEIQEILDNADVITLRTCERKKSGLMARLSLALVWPLLIILFVIKWLISGDGHLDSWAKKSKIVDFLCDIAEVK